MRTLYGPGRIYWGRGSITECGPAIGKNRRRVLFVTGKNSLDRSGHAARIVAGLEKNGLEYRRLKIDGEPTIRDVDAGRQLAREFAADCVLAVGGGSVIDAGKAVAGLAGTTDRVADYFERVIDAPGIAFTCAPTTAGTGSEATPNAVISDPARPYKASIRDDRMMPEIVFLDADLADDVRPEVAAASGMDAFCQAVESFLSIHATPVTDGIALGAIKIAAENLAAAFTGDRAARERMLGASFLAGHAMATARLGVVHGIAHPVGVRYGVPHGVICAVLLAPALRLNAPHTPEKYRTLENLLGADPTGFTEGLAERVGLGVKLRAFGASADDFEWIVAESLPSGSLKANPKKIDADDVVRILREVL